MRCLRLALRRDREFSEIEFRALCVSSDQISILGVEKREGLRAGTVCIDAHLNNDSTKQS